MPKKAPGWRAVHQLAIEKVERDGLTMDRFYELTGISETTFRKMGDGVPLKRPDKIRNFERGMGWQIGSAEWVAQGGTPTLIDRDEPMSEPAPTDDIAEVLDLARSMREGLKKSQSRDAKLKAIVDLCLAIDEHITTLTQTALDARASAARNEAVLAALVAHFGLVVDQPQA